MGPPRSCHGSLLLQCLVPHSVVACFVNHCAWFHRRRCSAPDFVLAAEPPTEARTTTTQTLDHEHGLASPVTGRPLAASRPGRLPGVLPPSRGVRLLILGRASHLDAFSGYRFPTWLPSGALLEQLAHQWSVHPGPLVLGTAPLKTPTPTADRDRTVSRRSEPSSRTALIGEQPNPWDLIQPQDATSRHRGAKPCRRCELLGKISLLSPG